MAKSAGVVEINGHRYDRATGAVVGAIDGFVRRKPHTKPVKAAAKKTQATPKKAPTRPVRLAKASARVHHRRQHSNTLMRTVVRRPALRLKQTSSAISKVGRPTARAIDNNRLEKAKAVSKSSKVSRFSLSTRSGVATNPKQVIKKTATVRPLSATPAATLPQTITSHQKLEQMLDKALLNADAHKQALNRRSYRLLRPFGLPGWASLILFGLIVLAIGAFIAWRSIPAIAIKVASVRSHITANVPAYVPSGFSFSHASSGNGNLTIKYSAKGDGASSYSVSQAPSSWDSQSLKANTLNNHDAVQTSEVDGTTVYIYGASDNAEWVSNGNLYKIDNQAHLSSNQILNIAQSL